MLQLSLVLAIPHTANLLRRYLSGVDYGSLIMNLNRPTTTTSHLQFTVYRTIFYWKRKFIADGEDGRLPLVRERASICQTDIYLLNSWAYFNLPPSIPSSSSRSPICHEDHGKIAQFSHSPLPKMMAKHQLMLPIPLGSNNDDVDEDEDEDDMEKCRS